jgi:hypothetical protein
MKGYRDCITMEQSALQTETNAFDWMSYFMDLCSRQSIAKKWHSLAQNYRKFYIWLFPSSFKAKVVKEKPLGKE